MKLGSKVFIPIVCVSALAVFLILFFIYTNFNQYLEQATGERQLSLAEQTLDKVDRLLYERYESIQVLANLPYTLTLVSKKNIDNSEPVRHHFQKFSSLTGPWDNINIYDTHGNTLFDLDNPNETNKIINNPDEVKAFDTAVKGDTYVSDVVISNNKLTVLYATPIRMDDPTDISIQGVVIGKLSWQLVNDLLSSVTTANANLYNSHGILIATGDPNKEQNLFKEKVPDAGIIHNALLGKSESKTLTMLPLKEQSLVSYTSQRGYINYKGSNWTIVFDTPTSIAYASTTKITRMLFIILTLLAMLSIGVALSIIYYLIVKPIGLLTKTVKAIAEGDLSKRVPIRGTDEVGQLAEAFNNMATRLQVSYQTLEDQVWQRTKELEEAKADLENKIKERTGELEQMNKHLGDEVTRRTADLAKQLDQTKRLNEVMVGREMRIVELKREIDRLKQTQPQR
jgi:HAMP domain-containing protein